MRLAFWNSTLPSGGDPASVAKRQTIQQFIFWLQPDLIFFTEMSYALNTTEGISNLISDCMRVRPPGPGVHERTNRYTCIAREPNRGVHLMMAIFAKPNLYNLPAGLIAVRGWADGQCRPLLHVEVPGERTSKKILLLHARASPAGGLDATNAMLTYLATHPSDLAGGDFNYDSYNDPGGALAGGNLAMHGYAEFFAPHVGVPCPLPVPMGGTPYTQFRRDAHGSQTLPGTYIAFNPGRRIDFLLTGSAHNGRVAAVDPMPARPPGQVSPWERAVFTHFDHLPVVYDWNPPR